MNNTLRNSKVDLLTTKDIDFHGRRIKNASDSKDKQDYVTKSELDKATGESIFTKLFEKLIALPRDIITKLISPPINSTTAIKVTKADRTTLFLNLDTTNGWMQFGNLTAPIRPNVAGRRYFTIKGISDGGFLELTQTIADADATGIGGIQFADSNCTAAEKRLAQIVGATNGATANDRGGRLVFYVKANAGAIGVILQLDNAAIGFFGAAPAAKQTLSAYSTSSRAAAFTSTPAALGTAATLADLNTLRASYEVLRLAYDDLRTKLQTTTLVG